MRKMIAPTIFMAIMLSIASCGMENQREQIVDFVYERDTKDVLKIIQDDWNLLFTSIRPNYDPKYVLQHEIPNKNLLAEKYKDKLKMKVLRKGERVVGFVTFYKEDSSVGRIRIISVAKDFRKKGYGKKLTIASINDLFDSGCTSVCLYTHKENEKVPTYKNLGFKEVAIPEKVISWYKKVDVPVEEYKKYTKYTVNKETFRP